jgi:hypothetical protein
MADTPFRRRQRQLSKISRCKYRPRRRPFLGLNTKYQVKITENKS